MNELFRKIFEHLGTAAAAVKEDMTLLLVNRRFEELFGLTKEEAEGKKKVTDLVEQKHQSKLYGQIRRLMNKTGENPSSVEIEFFDQKRACDTLFVNAAPLPDTGLFVLSFCRAAGCHLAWEDFLASYRQLNEIVDFLPDPAFVIDRHFRVVAWNKGMEEITGIPRKEIIGKKHIYRSLFYENP